MVRLVELRPWVRIRPESGTPAWPRRQQVHLVRFDVQRRWLPILPDAQTREVMAWRGMSGFPLIRQHRAKAGMRPWMPNSRQPKWTSGPSKLMVCGIWKDGNSAVISGQIGSH